VFVFLLLPVKAYAYLDMGTGSMLLQLLVAGLAGAAVFLRIFWIKIKHFFARNKEDEQNGTDSTDHE
jgi:hypothetical protein